MGKNNKKRRAAKAKQKAKARAKARGQGGPHDGQTRGHHSPWDDGHNHSHSHSHNPDLGGFQRSERERIEALIDLVILSHRRNDPQTGATARRRLAEAEPALVDREIERELLRTLTVLWDNGWLPPELAHQVRRRSRVAAVQALGWAIAADHHLRSPDTIHPRWRVHLDRLDLPEVTGAQGWLAGGAAEDDIDRWDRASDALDALAVISDLGSLAEIVPPPGSAEAAGASGEPLIDLTTATADPVMEKVRGLLAQAESTTFEAEAEAFTAKAQELMARHSIDAALLWGRSGRQGREEPTIIRLLLLDPYLDAKSLLLQVVAEHTRCRAIYHTHYAMSSLIGFDVDLAAAETLFTSLLIQAQTALRQEAANTRAGARTRSRSFRSSFLVAYTNRIGERLAEVNTRVEQEVATSGGEGSGDLLPVLADRSARIDDKIEEQFGNIITSTVRGGHDLQGWQAGYEAADAADLGDGDKLGSAPTSRAEPLPAGAAPTQEALPL